MMSPAENFTPGLHVAQRTCVGCKRLAARDELVRVVQLDGAGPWVMDIRRRLPGRGISLHPVRRCIQQAIKQGRLRHGAQPVTAAELADSARAQYQRRMEGLVVAALRARQLAVGTEAVRQALSERTLALLIVAEDAAGHREDFEQAAERLGRRCMVWGTKLSLGALLGRQTVGVLGVLDESIGDELRSAAQHISALAEDA